MAIKIIRQFMVDNRHRLPPSKEGLKEFISNQAVALLCHITDEKVEQLAAEFELLPKMPICEAQNEKTPKPSRKRQY